jgi:hypothetical protein
VGYLNEHGKIYWHEAFFEALQLELHQYRDFLEFESEHRLSKEALRVDVLVIKKNKDVRIEKNIGKIFKEHNLFEYKSELDSFSFWDYNKVMGYALLYSSFERVPMSEITVSIALTMFPRELIKALESENGFTVQDLGNGIYYIEGGLVPIQILESKRLSKSDNLFLRNLRSNLSAEDMLNTLESYQAYRPLDNKSVFLERLVKANSIAFEEVMNMSDAVIDIIIEAAEKNGRLKDRFVDRKTVAKKLIELGDSVEKVAEATGLSVETVEGLA